MPLTYVQHKTISLKAHPDFDEAWLQSRIAEDPSILGLGDAVLIGRERSQGNAGRLDLLLSNPDENVRFEVDMMLGPTDPSHIIRTIEYWDIERRRYPAYEHIAVLVAEDVTARFLNVLALLSGSIPLIAIQLNALQVGESIILDFVYVLDQTELRVDELNYNQQFVGLTDGRRSRNFLVFKPAKSHLRVEARVGAADEWVARLEDAGLSATAKRNRVSFHLTAKLFAEHRQVVDDLIQHAASEAQG
jgi:hypothetical protein